MAGGARVESFDALRSVKIAMAKFADEAIKALDEAGAELQRTLVWLETERLAYWQVQQWERSNLVLQAREAVRNKTMYKDLSGRTPSAVDEKEALRIAVRRLEEAEEKVRAVRKWVPQLKHEIMNYNGGVQRLATEVQSDVPLAIGQLEGMMNSLDAYLALKTPDAHGAARGEMPAEENVTPPENADEDAGGKKAPG